MKNENTKLRDELEMYNNQSSTKKEFNDIKK